MADVIADPRITIESHEDDSVTLTVDGYTAHIRGPSWGEANHAAHMLGGLLAGKRKASAVLAKLRRMESAVGEFERAIETVDHHLQRIVEECRE